MRHGGIFATGVLSLVGLIVGSVACVEAETQTSPAFASHDSELAESDPTILLRSVNISGVTAFDGATLQAVVADALGQRLAFSDLTALADRITWYYRDHGYTVARAYVPEQQVERGTIEIAVLEGRYGEIVLENESRLRSSAARRLLGGLRAGDLIRKVPLERALLLLDDLPGVRVTSTLRMGSVAGTSDLIVRLHPEGEVDGHLSVENNGNRLTGVWRNQLAAGYSNPAGLGDRLMVSGLFATGGGLVDGRVSYTVPVGHGPLEAGASIGSVHYTLGEAFSVLDATGEATSVSASLRYPFQRAAGRTLKVGASVTHQALTDRVFGSATDKRNDALTVEFSGSSMLPGNGTGVLTYEFHVTRGELQIDTASARTRDAQTAQTQGPYVKVGAEFGYERLLAPRSNLLVSMRGQQAFMNLDESAKFSLGGATGVRAYPPGEASGDTGWLTSLTLEHAPEVLDNWPGSWRVEGFADAGGITMHADPWPNAETGGRVLSGAGAGLLWSGGDIYSAALEYACKLGSEVASSDEDRPCRLWTRATASF